MTRFRLWLLIGMITLACRAAIALEEAYEFDHPTDRLPR
jgi:hypothetical protein